MENKGFQADLSSIDFETSGFHPVDFLFSQKLLPNACQNASLFLAYLLKSAREGHICVALSPTLDARLLEGAALLPDALFEDMLVRKGDLVYLRRNWDSENLFLTHLRRLQNQKPSIMISSDGLKKELEKQTLNVEQKQAILKAAESTLTLISGGPGTGKSYTASILVRLFLESGIEEVIVAAPTGKATANIRAYLGPMAEKCTIKTLHALLKKERLSADLIVVDEGSMVDAERMAALFSAVKDGARLILLGDKDQLPPVEAGNFFADIAMLENVIIELTTCLRTDLQEIVEKATLVKKGLSIPAHPLPEIKPLIDHIIKNPQVQVLTPLRKGPYGVDNLNRLLYTAHQNRGAKEIPIMISVNDPYLELFNGDIGILVKEENTAHFSGGRKFPEYLLPRYEYAYALSVHKSQGSEYERVLVLLPKGSESFGREMLYTALTRAKKQVEIFADKDMMASVVANRSRRLSGIPLLDSSG